MSRAATTPKTVETDPHKLDVEAIAKEALAYALRRGKRLSWRSGSARMATLPVAEDAAADAMESLFGGSRKWNPAECPDAWQHVCSTINSILWNRLISSDEKAKRVEPHTLGDRDPTDPEMVLLSKEEQQWQRNVENLFMGRVLEDPELLTVYSAMEQLGTDKPATLAKHLGLPVREIDSRKRKLRALMSAVFKEALMAQAEEGVRR